jgi:hypothetical protein
MILLVDMPNKFIFIGVPTIIMESPIGVNSDIWLPLQEKLSKISKVKYFQFLKRNIKNLIYLCEFKGVRLR